MSRWLIPWLCFFWIGTGVATGEELPSEENLTPGCPDAKVFGSGMITDICWSCLFPIRIAGIELDGSAPEDEETETPEGDSPPRRCVSVTPTGESTPTDLCVAPGHQQAPPGAASDMLCVCPDPLGVPEPGMVMGMWQPARLIEVVRLPYCSPSLGGVFLRQYTRLLGGWRGAEGDTSDATFYHFHYFAFPLLIMLDLFLDADCNADGYHDFDLMYLSELDPTWNSDELAFLLSPETAIFANPIALAACLVDAGLATVGKPQDSLFWCAGTWGNLYPLTGTINWEGSPPRDTSLIATRAVAALHRRGLAWRTMGNEAVCRSYIYPTLPKTQYKLSQYYPLAEANGSHWIGQSTFTWGEWRNIPAVGEDFVHVLWRWTDCCLRF